MTMIDPVGFCLRMAPLKFAGTTGAGQNAPMRQRLGAFSTGWTMSEKTMVKIALSLLQ